MANYTLKDAPDYPAFGIAPQGVYGGPVDEVIPVPGPLEPAYAVLAEDFNAGGVNPAWVSGDRAGAGQLLVGDGTPAIPAEILFRGKLRIDTPPPAATGRFIMGVGDNTVVSDCGILQMYVQTFALKIDFGVNNTIKSQISFSTVTPFTPKS